jgi:hypothetical protein
MIPHGLLDVFYWLVASLLWFLLTPFGFKMSIFK